jgi:transcription elongation GreA/GreB family factor
MNNLKVPTKQEILAAIIASIEGNISFHEKMIEQTRQDVIAAPSRMQSRYDSSRQELSYQFDKLNERLGELLDHLNSVKIMNIAETRAVGIGSIVTTNEQGVTETYFVSVGGEGKVLKVNDFEIIVISPSAPLALELMGKKRGQCITFRSRQIEIVAIQ